MTITLHIPDEAVVALRRAVGDNLDRAALEALAIEGYRNGKLGLHDLAALLGFETRIEAQTWLGERKIPLCYDLEDLETDRRNLAKFFPEMSR